MTFNVSEFASSGLPLGGARPSLFSVIIDTPSGVPNIGARVSFTCKAAQIPESSISVIEASYFGRKIKLAGTRSFANWTPTILNDEDFQVRHALEVWSNAINRHQANLRETQLTTTQSYRTTATVTQYNKVGVPVRSYEFINLFPVNLQAIDVNWDTDAIEEFSCEFAYDYWRVAAPTITGTLAI
jgi:hypothetical protein